MTDDSAGKGRKLGKVDVALAIHKAKLGVAISQLSMGHWSPEFFRERVAVYDEELRTAMDKVYPWKKSLLDRLFALVGL